MQEEKEGSEAERGRSVCSDVVTVRSLHIQTRGGDRGEGEGGWQNLGMAGVLQGGTRVCTRILNSLIQCRFKAQGRSVFSETYHHSISKEHPAEQREYAIICKSDESEGGEGCFYSNR